MRSLLLPSLHSLDSLYVQGKDLYIASDATSATIINSQSAMDISDSGSNIVACSGPCTASIGNVCTAAASNKGGVVCSLPACPTIFAGSGWNEWSASCSMSATHTVTSGETVKIKKSAAMLGELVIDRGSDTSGFGNRHFLVYGTLEMEDVTLKGGHAVSSFCSLSSL